MTPAALRCREVYAKLVPLRSQVANSFTSPAMRSMYSTYFDEFFKFVSLKAVYGNDKGTDISPGFIVDTIWHNVMNDPVYNKIQAVCYAVCHRRIKHHPERARDPPNVIEMRYLLSQYIMAKVFKHTDVGTFTRFCKDQGKALIDSFRSEPNFGC